MINLSHGALASLSRQEAKVDNSCHKRRSEEEWRGVGKVEEGGRGGCIVGSGLPNSEGLRSGSLWARGRAVCGAVGDVVPPPHMGSHPASGAKRQGDSYRQRGLGLGSEGGQGALHPLPLLRCLTAFCHHCIKTAIFCSANYQTYSV